MDSSQEKDVIVPRGSSDNLTPRGHVDSMGETWVRFGERQIVPVRPSGGIKAIILVLVVSSLTRLLNDQIHISKTH